MSELASGTAVGTYLVTEFVGRIGDLDEYRVTRGGATYTLMVAPQPESTLCMRIIMAGRVQASFFHPNVVAVTDVVDIDGIPALVMEHVAGPHLSELIAQGPLTTPMAHGLMCGILRGVSAIHQRRLVHRNLTPENILIDQTIKYEPIPRITNFIMAKTGSLDPTTTVSGMALGTPQYMAPEQIRDSTSVDGRADVFALGAIAYELLSGVRAFERTDVVATFRAIARGVYPPLPHDVPTELGAIIAYALEVDHMQRLNSVEAFIDRWTAAYESFGNEAITETAPMPGDDGLAPDDVPTEEEPAPPKKRSWWPWG
ncbi:MAG: serine/threonine protein kinase [Proteobacteria bacterium]|nr:serine/threonine protein kinase [Pseudomonadota bacterium]